MSKGVGGMNKVGRCMSKRIMGMSNGVWGISKGIVYVERGSGM